MDPPGRIRTPAAEQGSRGHRQKEQDDILDQQFPGRRSIAASVCTETNRAANPITTGIVKSVTTLLNAVSVTDKATSPLASIEKTFDELPPGQQAISISPMNHTGGSRNASATPKAMSGSARSCPSSPATTAAGRRNTPANACRSSSIPSWNISTIRMGSTIQMVFIAAPE